MAAESASLLTEFQPQVVSLAERSQAVRAALSKDSDAIVGMVVRSASKFYANSPADFSIHQVESDGIVFGFRNHVTWKPDTGFTGSFWEDGRISSTDERMLLAERSQVVHEALSRNFIALSGMIARSASRQFQGDPSDFSLSYSGHDKLTFGSQARKEWRPETGFNRG